MIAPDDYITTEIPLSLAAKGSIHSKCPLKPELLVDLNNAGDHTPIPSFMMVFT
jgi:hypothetical protein